MSNHLSPVQVEHPAGALLKHGEQVVGDDVKLSPEARGDRVGIGRAGKLQLDYFLTKQKYSQP